MVSVLQILAIIILTPIVPFTWNTWKAWNPISLILVSFITSVWRLWKISYVKLSLTHPSWILVTPLQYNYNSMHQLKLWGHNFHLSWDGKISTSDLIPFGNLGYTQSSKVKECEKYWARTSYETLEWQEHQQETKQYPILSSVVSLSCLTGQFWKPANEKLCNNHPIGKSC